MKRNNEGSLKPAVEHTVADRINALIGANNLKRLEVALHCGVSYSTASNWVYGKAVPSRGVHLLRLAQILNSTECYIAFGITEPTTESGIVANKLGMLSRRKLAMVNDLIDELISPLKEQQKDA